jgi:hypothetical protein
MTTSQLIYYPFNYPDSKPLGVLQNKQRKSYSSFFKKPVKDEMKRHTLESNMAIEFTQKICCKKLLSSWKSCPSEIGSKDK